MYIVKNLESTTNFFFNNLTINIKKEKKKTFAIPELKGITEVRS